jgi:hypothetical protein
MARANAVEKRAALVARKDAALRRWPDRAGTEYEAEMADVAHQLDMLARALDSVDTDPIERLRAWCSVGEAYLLLGARTALHSAAEAFRYAEAAANRAEADAHELMKLKHQYGLALLKLAEDQNAELAAEAAARLSTALALARKHMPVGVVSIKYELFRAEHTVTRLRGTRRAERRDERAVREAEAA